MKVLGKYQLLLAELVKMSLNMKTKTKKYKKKEEKSRSLLVLNVHTVNLMLSVSQLAQDSKHR